MKFTAFAAAGIAAAALMSTATAAGAVSLVTINYPIALGNPNSLPSGQTMVVNFNQEQVTNLTSTPYSYTTLVAGYEMILDGATVSYREGDSGYSGTLPPELYHYLTVLPASQLLPAGGKATLMSSGAFKAFSFYMGSPDDYNFIDVYGSGGYHETINGSTLVAGDTNQEWSYGRRINVNIGGSQTINKVVFSATNYSFELDNIAVAAVPEPQSWALMIMGFGAAGALVRRRRRAVA